jgi:hypothetical protein
MPKVYDIGKRRFIQLIKFPVKWEGKLAVKGWTQEIEEPFRTAAPLIVRLPFHRALVLGKWTGQQTDEESALNNATQGRLLTYEDFEEGWTPAPEQVTEENLEDFYSRTDDLG